MRIVSCLFRDMGFRPRLTMARANISGASSGVSEKSILRSWSASTRFQSVRDFLEVAGFFIPRCLSNRNDSDDFMGLGMRNDNHAAAQQTQSNEPRFTVIKPIIQDRNCCPGKNPFNPYEIDPMLLNVGLPLGFIPFKEHVAIVATFCSYVNREQRSRLRELPVLRIQLWAWWSVPLRTAPTCGGGPCCSGAP